MSDVHNHEHAKENKGVGPASSLRTVIGVIVSIIAVCLVMFAIFRVYSNELSDEFYDLASVSMDDYTAAQKSGSRVVHQRGELRHLHHVRVGRVPGHRSFRLDVRCVSRGMEPTGGRSRLPMLQSRRWSRALRAIATSGTRKRFGICTQARRWCPTCASRTA